MRGFCWGSLDELFGALPVDLDLLFSQFIDLFLLVGQQLLKFFPLRLQIRVSALQKLVLILILQPSLLLLVHLLLPLLQFPQRFLGNRSPRAIALLPALRHRQFLHYSLVILPKRCYLLIEGLDILRQRFFLGLPVQLLRYPLLLFVLFLLAPFSLLEAVLFPPGFRGLEVVLPLMVEVPLLPVSVRLPEPRLN